MSPQRIALVETPQGATTRYYNATAEFFKPNTKALTIVSVLSGEDIAFFSPAEWRAVTVLDQRGDVLFGVTQGVDRLKVIALPPPHQWPIGAA